MGELEMPMTIGWFDPEPISISHWGHVAMQMPAPLMMVPEGFEFDERDLRMPGHIVWVQEANNGRC